MVKSAVPTEIRTRRRGRGSSLTRRRRAAGTDDAGGDDGVVLTSPVGPLLLRSAGERLVEIRLPRSGAAPRAPGPGTARVLEEAARQLRQYFAHERTEFELPLDLRGTEFQLRVWRELLAIPYGETVSYGELAQRTGNPRAARAVGAANGRNPIPIVVPCHRVIGCDGALVGFGGGLPLKEQLLAHEGVEFQPSLF